MNPRLVLIMSGGAFPLKLLQRFEQEGFKVQICMEKEQIIPYLVALKPGFIILDSWSFSELEEMVLRCLEKTPEIPLIVLSEEEKVALKVKLLEMGVYDYLQIPYHLDELVARVKTLLRREGKLRESIMTIPSKAWVFHYDPKKKEIYKNQVPLALSLREYQLLQYLLTKENHVFSRKELLTKVWGYGEKQERYCDIRTVDVTVRRIREKIEDNTSKPKYLLTKRGLGYYFRNSYDQENEDLLASVEISFKK